MNIYKNRRFQQTMPFFHIFPKTWSFIWFWWIAQYIQKASGTGKLFFPNLCFAWVHIKNYTLHLSHPKICAVTWNISESFLLLFCHQQSFTKQHAFIHSIFQNISYKCQQLSTTWNICGFVHLWGKVIDFHTL